MTRDEYQPCKNCDGRKCMACIFREPHPRCDEDCPECCNPVLFDVDDYRPPEESYGYRF